jgi:hypothetical protein
MAIPLTTITIPTPQPYDEKDPERQRENYFYVWLQILQAAKTAGESVSLNPSTSLSIDLSDLVQAVKDLAFNGYEFSLPGLLEGQELTFRFTHKTTSLLSQ